MKRLGVISTALSMLLGAAFAWAATDVEQFTVKGDAAEAFFSMKEGCDVTYVGVYAFEQAVRQKSAPAVIESVVNVFIDVVDQCTWEYVTSAYGSAVLGVDDFVVGKKLSSASLDAAVEVYEYITGNTMEVSLDVSWIAVEPLVKSSSRFTYKSEGFSVKGSFKGSFRSAKATGGIEVDGSDLGLGQADYAAIMILASSSMTKTPINQLFLNR
jgi:hypothetical protein